MNWNAQASDTPSQLTGALDIDYLWSIGYTPYGYFSHVTASSLSFAVRDAAMRHIIYSEINETISGITDLLHHFHHYGRQMDEVSTPMEHLHLVRRRNILVWKMSRVHHFLSLNSFNQSLYYLRSAAHDVAAIHRMVHMAMERLQPSIWCGTYAEKLNEQSSTSWWITLTIAHIFQWSLLLTCIGVIAIWSCLPKGTDMVLSRIQRHFTKTKEW
jgi:hypothetical protein